MFAFYAGGEDKQIPQLVSTVRDYLLTACIFPGICGVKLAFLFKRLVFDNFLEHFQIYFCLYEDRKS